MARYRLPGNLHLTDNQVRAINETVNGIAGSYVNMDTLEILDPASCQKYLGIEAAEGTRTPDQDVNDYLADLSRKSGTEANEYISATVKVENIYDDSSNQFGEPLAQDLIITFTPYSIEENQHTYDSTGTPTRAGTDIEGWLALDFNLSQVDWNASAVNVYEREVESEIEGDNEGDNEGQNEIDNEVENEADTADENEADNEDVNEVHNEGVNENAASVETVERCEKTADIVFVAEGRDEQGNKIREISTSLKLVEETVIETSAADPHTASGTPGDQENTENTAGDDVANDANNDRTAEAADATDDSAEGQKPVDDSDEDQNKSEEDPYTDGTLTAEGDGYAITLTCTADAKIPADAKLNVTEITEESDPEAYAACLEQAEASVNADKAASASDTSDGTEGTEAGRKVDKKATRFFDIEIRTTTVDENGQEKTDKIEPAAPVAVNIQLEDNTGTSSDPASESAVESGAAANDGQTSQNPAPTVIHFAEEGVEKLDSTIVAPTTDSATDSTADPTVESTADPTSGSTARENDGRSDTKQPVTEVQFQAESFSIYGVVYTVDFHYEVNGKMYDFSIPGGGFVSLEHLVEVLGIEVDAANSGNASTVADNSEDFSAADDEYDVVEVPGVEGEIASGESTDSDGVAEVSGVEDGGASDSASDDVPENAAGSTSDGTYEQAISLNNVAVSDKTREFVADIVSVEFSNPSLVWVGKVEEASTIGGLKKANGLDCEYSADLTEEQINEINSSTVEGGDWALISVHPFTSEESLTVTMKNGDQWTVIVTDAQQINYNNGPEDYFRYLVLTHSYDASTNTNYYRVLKRDGTTESFTSPDELDALGNEYLWTYKSEYNGNNVTWTNGNVFIDIYSEQLEKPVNPGNPEWKCVFTLQPVSGGGYHFKDVIEDIYLGWDANNGFKRVTAESEATRIRLYTQSNASDSMSSRSYKVTVSPSGAGIVWHTSNTFYIQTDADDQNFYSDLKLNAIATATMPYNWNQGVRFILKENDGETSSETTIDYLDENGRKYKLYTPGMEEVNENLRDYVFSDIANTKEMVKDPVGVFRIRFLNVLGSIDVAFKKVGVNNTDQTGTQNILGGAKFTLYEATGTNKDEKGSIVSIDDDLFQNKTSDGTTGIFWSGSLPIGEYLLEETEAPNGYVKIGVLIKVVVTEDGVTLGYVGTTGTAPYNEPTKEGDTWTITAINTAGVSLPNTGGPGANLIYLIGLMLTAFAGAGLVMKRRRRNAA